MDENGNVISADLMSYMSESFLHYTFLWYDKIMPIIAQYQESEGGPITMMQVCNEVGVFQWLSGRIDYHDSIISLYKSFLIDKYNAIHRLNLTYGTSYFSFDEIKAPAGKINNKQEYCAYYDFHLFYRHYYALYLDTLIKKIRDYGVDLQLTHNIPGWIYGNAAELPMLISTYEEVMRKRPDIVFGLDHIPEFVSFRNAHSDLACNKILEAMQSSGPVWAAEFQSGTREHHVRSDAKDLETFYYASLAHGLKGMNYYMFSQGINPKGKGYFGKTFYFQTPLDSKTIKSRLYSSIKTFNRFVNQEKENLLQSQAKANICVGFYKPYFYTELTTSQLLRDKKLDVAKLGLVIDPRFVREEILFNGLLRGLQTLNFNYDINDLENCSVENLLTYKQLWVVTTEFMDGKTQQLLGSFVKKGGHLVIYPAIPTLDLYLNPCTILKDELGIQFAKSASANKIDAFNIEDIFTFYTEKQIFHANVDEVISKTKTGDICGIRKKVGNGIVTLLGFGFGYTSDEHLQLYEKIVLLDKIKRQAEVSDSDIQFVIRRGKKYSYLFLLNYHNEKKTFTVDSKKYTMNAFSCKVIKRNR